MATTGNVSGLKISRNGGDIIFEWKQPTVWFTDWQKAWWSDSTVYHTKNRWGTLSVIKEAEKRVSTWGTAKYFPNTKKKLTYVGICLQGKANGYSASGYVYGWYYFYPPKKPTVTVEVGDYPSTSFKWEVSDNGATTQYWYINSYIWTVLVKNSSQTNGDKVPWSTNFTNAQTTYNYGGVRNGTKYERVLTGGSGTFTVTEDSSLLNDGNSYTRWFCICSRGPAGQSSYTYAKHVYALPYQATITNYKITRSAEASGYRAQIYFDAPKNAQHPLDYVVVQYALAVPDDGITCPDGASWQDGSKVLVSDKTSGATFSIDSLVASDQCLFVRVNTIYDNRTTYGEPVAVDFGRLKAPNNLTVVTNASTHVAEITATNQSTVPDSFLVVRYMTEDDPNGFDLGIIPNGESSATVQCPEWESTPTFGVYAAAPADSYTIRSGYLVEPSDESSYSISQIDIDDGAFYEQVGGRVGDFEFVYNSEGDWSVERNEESTVDPALYSIDEYNFYIAVNKQFDTYSFVYSESLDAWSLSESEEIVDLQGYGITLNSNYAPTDEATIMINLNPVATWLFTNKPMTIHNGIQLIDYGITLRLGGTEPADDDTVIVSIKELPDGVSKYEVSPVMRSNLVTYGGTVPDAPEITVSQTNVSGTVRVKWNWSWNDADGAELSWADHEDAWESTSEPSTYTVTKLNSSAWNISGLEAGQKWYIRVRLFKRTSSGETFGTYSNTAVIDLASAPLVPVLSLSESAITKEGSVNVSWVYSTSDGTGQASAELAEVNEIEIDNQTVKTYTIIAQTKTSQHITIDAKEQGWDSGETHVLACRVVSESGRASDGWSNEVSVNVAEPITCEIQNTSLETVTISYPNDEGTTTDISTLALTEMPMTVTVKGAGEYGQTTLSIERAADYHVDRPDETDYNGFEGETIFTYNQVGEDEITINLEDLIGHLDDTAPYKIVATVQDGIGQTAVAELNFDVRWSHQPDAPTANVTIDSDNLAAILEPIAPENAAETDVCDIYRLSVDKPELIYESAVFGEEYVDPYPTIGEFGGYRFVTRTANGDYITDGEDKSSFAWTDTDGNIDVGYNIIDFGNDRIQLDRNIDISNSWTKNFKETQYLGGSVQGDWNKAVGRSGSINAVAIKLIDQDIIESIRRLSMHTGACHIRTIDGSSYWADVQVSESYTRSTGNVISSISLKITRINKEQNDGLPYQDWQEANEV